MKRMTIFWLIGIAVVAVVAIFYWTRSGNSKQETYQFAKIDRGDVLVAISATGTLNAVTTVQVGTQVSGTIAKLYADFNSQVKEGQLLAQLDPTFLKASVSEQKANLDRATAQLNEAKRNFNRATELRSKQLISQVELDVATTSLETAQASLRQAEAARDRAEVNLKYATILAPISGVVISRNVDVGQTVAASLSAPTLFTIANDLSKMQVTACVDEADIGQVKTGQRVTFRVDSYAERQFDGVVSQIRLSPVVAQNVVTYNVIIDVENPDQKLMPGMTATCSIEVASVKDVLRIPLSAFRFIPANGTADTATRPEREGGAMATPAVPSGQPGDSMGRPNSRPMGDSARRGKWAGRERGGGDSASMRRPEMKRDSLKSENAQRARVWVMEDGKLKPIRVMRGIQNQRYAELIMSPLAEGDSVIVGTNSPAASATTSGTNPFMPRMPGGGGGGTRGR
jgi:HlyD family secretion protein